MVLGIGRIFNGIGQLTKTFSCQKPNAKSVSERIWQMSHNMRFNAGNTLPTLLSQSSALYRGYEALLGDNAWQMPHHVKPNTLAAL